MGGAWDIGMGEEFFGSDLKSTGNKSKNGKWYFIKLKNFCIVSNQQNEEMIRRMKENIFKLHNWQKVDIQNM